ncbi:hypothetical protein ATCC90586_011265 [Pythium insidiosum]|nr:hypothetical protein ATCC90586_011265 [Pythium insidiosum]
MEEAEAVCANAVVLSKGKVVWSGSIPELKQHASRGISISLRLDTASIWDPERVRYYVDKIRHGRRVIIVVIVVVIVGIVIVDGSG